VERMGFPILSCIVWVEVLCPLFYFPCSLPCTKRPVANSGHAWMEDMERTFWFSLFGMDCWHRGG